MKHHVIKIELVYKNQPPQHIKAKDIEHLISPDTDDLFQYKKYVASILQGSPDGIYLTFDTDEVFIRKPQP